MKTLWFLHGNLQQPSVWQPLIDDLNLEHLEWHTKPINLWETLADSCWAWSDNFCSMVQSLSDHNNYIVGYSLGGRLAMHALLSAPTLWSGAIIVSAMPGLTDGQQKEQCLTRDRNWANRFLSEPWHDLLAEWDRLPVFCDRLCTTPRPEADFDRSQIARIFECYSKGHMDDLRGPLQTLNLPITFITGSEDQRYKQIGMDLAQSIPSLRHISIDQAGHRVPWEQPDAFLAVLIDALGF